MREPDILEVNKNSIDGVFYSERLSFLYNKTSVTEPINISLIKKFYNESQKLKINVFRERTRLLSLFLNRDINNKSYSWCSDDII